MQRRTFLRQTAGLTLAGLTGFPSLAGIRPQSFESKRPPLSARKFTSPAVEERIAEVKQAIANPELAWMFENCFPNTLDTTVDFEIIDGKPDTFVITGDIDAMWLRDSTAQVWPYLPLMRRDDALRRMIEGLIRRQTKCVLLDPYANAFYKDTSRTSMWHEDRPEMKPGIHERKWEIDSLCYPVRLAFAYFRLTGDPSVFDERWQAAARLIVDTFKTEQRKDGTTPYRFIRRGTVMIDAPPFEGTGRPVHPVGLIASAFRPSDDSTLYPFLIPSNIFAVQALRQLAELYTRLGIDSAFATECYDLADEVETAVMAYGTSEHLYFGRIYAYEVDGFGNQLFMDDANVPSLIALTYIGVHEADDPLYRNSRRFVLSDANPWFLRGAAADGQASPHTGKTYVWPMGFILRALTSTSDPEIAKCLRLLLTTHADTGFIHEAFHKDDPAQYTRDWFAWANTLFGELIVKLFEERPELLQRV